MNYNLMGISCKGEDAYMTVRKREIAFLCDKRSQQGVQRERGELESESYQKFDLFQTVWKSMSSNHSISDQKQRTKKDLTRSLSRAHLHIFIYRVMHTNETGSVYTYKVSSISSVRKLHHHHRLIIHRRLRFRIAASRKRKVDPVIHRHGRFLKPSRRIVWS